MPPKPPKKHHLPAFSLLELLVAAAISMILLGALMPMATRMLRAGLRDDNQQTAQDAWARVQQFLAIEVGEAGRTYQGTTAQNPIEAPATANECGGATTPGFTLRVPPDPDGGAASSRAITYYVQNGNLMRCGPPVRRDGTLDLTAASSSAVVSYNTQLTAASAFGDRGIDYTLQFNSPQSGQEYRVAGRAWAQSSLIQEDGFIP